MNYAASLLGFGRVEIFALDFPLTTPAEMTTSTGSSMVGRSYIMSSIMFSMIERRALAPFSWILPARQSQ